MVTPMHAEFVPPEFDPPSTAQWRRFTLNALGLAGISSLSAGGVFFLAANWQLMNRWQRFSLFEALFLLSAVVAWHARAESLWRQAALAALTVLGGVLLGLYGQTYQTGADTYELFLTWATIALPFAWLSRHPAHWALWALIANIGFGLFVDTLGGFDRLALIVGSGHDSGPSSAWLLLAFANTGLALALRRVAAAEWLSRVLLALGAAIGSQAIALQMGWNSAQTIAPLNAALYLMLCAALVAIALRARLKDIFPLALLGSSLIYLSVVYAVTQIKWENESAFFVLSFWVLGTTAGLVFALLKLHQHWQRGLSEAKQ